MWAAEPHPSLSFGTFSGFCLVFLAECGRLPCSCRASGRDMNTADGTQLQNDLFFPPPLDVLHTSRGRVSFSPLPGTNIWSQGRASFLGTFWGLKFEALCAPILGPLGRVSEDPQTPKPLPFIPSSRVAKTGDEGRGEEAAGIPHTSARGLFTGGGKRLWSAGLTMTPHRESGHPVMSAS